MFHDAPLAQLLFRVGFEEARDAASFVLGAMERRLGIGDQCRHIGSIGRRDGDANADADFDLGPVDLDGQGERPQQGLGGFGGRGGLIGVGQDQIEFVAADPRQKRAVRRVLQAARHDLDDLVGGGMSEDIVDFLEPVEIDAKRRHALLMRLFQRFGEPFAERDPIGQAGQCVMAGQMGDALVGAVPFGKVIDDGQQVERVALLIENRHSLRRRIAHAAARRVEAMLVVKQLLAVLKNEAVALQDQRGGLLIGQFSRCLADDAVARRAEEGFRGAVHQDMPEVARVLDDDRGRHVLDDRVEEFARALNFRFGALALGDVDRGDEGRRAPAMIEEPRIDRHFDQLAIRLPMTPAHAVQIGAVVGLCDPARAIPVLGRTNIEDRHGEELLAADSRNGRSRRR